MHQNFNFLIIASPLRCSILVLNLNITINLSKKKNQIDNSSLSLGN